MEVCNAQKVARQAIALISQQAIALISQPEPVGGCAAFCK
jgi:hypothetical protein